MSTMNNEYLSKLAEILKMLSNLEEDLNLMIYNETEKKIYYTIASLIHSSGKCNISDVVNSSGYSRSTVYKAIKNFEKDNMVRLIQSSMDRREVFLELMVI